MRIARTYYSGIERGVRNVSIVNVEKVAKGLKTSLPKLFDRD
jgi:transcriptional regulator with XRE-family HTH domain